jgi:hypothetical protein
MKKHSVEFNAGTAQRQSNRLANLRRKDRTGSKGSSSADDFIGRQQIALLSGRASITPVIMLPPDVPGRERMPMPG